MMCRARPTRAICCAPEPATRRWRPLLCWLAGLAAPAAQATCESLTGPLRAIEFSGNAVTREQTLLRELPFQAGERVTPAQAEAGRQAIHNLRLFRDVKLHCRDGDTGAVIRYHVKEKFYLLPAPKADANSDGQYSYGLQLRWFNVAGRNQTLKLDVDRDNQREPGRGTGLNYALNYAVPWWGETLWGLQFGAARREEPVERQDLDARYTEITHSASALLSRHFPMRSRSQGLTLGTGFEWQDQDTAGAQAIAPFGQATGVLLTGQYQDIVFRKYSETGIEGSFQLAGAGGFTGADYDYSRAQLQLSRSWPVGRQPHRSFGLQLAAGHYSGGPRDLRFRYELGGSGDLHGYANRTLEVDEYVHLRAEYLHPAPWPWLRGVLTLETARGWAGAEETPGRWLSSVALGLRVRLTAFVRLQADLGMAWPLQGLAPQTDAARFYATGSR